MPAMRLPEYCHRIHYFNFFISSEQIVIIITIIIYFVIENLVK